LPGPAWRPTPHQGAAADELENADFVSRGLVKKIVFALHKISETLTPPGEKFFEGSLEIESHCAKSVRRQVPNPGLLRGFPAHHRPMSLFEGYGHADREPKGL
jgi:hypothetical protein